MTKIFGLLLVLTCLALAGCGDEFSAATFSDPGYAGSFTAQAGSIGLPSAGAAGAIPVDLAGSAGALQAGSAGILGTAGAPSGTGGQPDGGAPQGGSAGAGQGGDPAQAGNGGAGSPATYPCADPVQGPWAYQQAKRYEVGDHATAVCAVDAGKSCFQGNWYEYVCASADCSGVAPTALKAPKWTLHENCGKLP